LSTNVDAHDEVFRINWPPLGGSYAADVGAYTTHMITNRASLHCNQRIADDEPPVCRDSFEDDLIELTNWRLCYKFLQVAAVVVVVVVVVVVLCFVWFSDAYTRTLIVDVWRPCATAWCVALLAAMGRHFANSHGPPQSLSLSLLVTHYDR
jgi:hypothetical protein